VRRDPSRRRRHSRQGRATPAAYRKVTYSLPESVASELDRRSARNERRKSRVVAEALAFYFAAQDRQALALLYSGAAQDPQFRADNEAVDRDFAALDRELDDPQR
jgi:hypothetical protein